MAGLTSKPRLTSKQKMAGLSLPNKTTPYYRMQNLGTTKGSNVNSWESAIPYTQEQTALGYGAVPAMTMNTAQPIKGLVADPNNSILPVQTALDKAAFDKIGIGSGDYTSNLGSNYKLSNGTSYDSFNNMTPAQQDAFIKANPMVGLGNANNSWVDGMSNYETAQSAAVLGNALISGYGTFGPDGTMDVNKKNIELMDQQIANNKDIMKTRTERAGDIKKYFG